MSWKEATLAWVNCLQVNSDGAELTCVRQLGNGYFFCEVLRQLFDVKELSLDKTFETLENTLTGFYSPPDWIDWKDIAEDEDELLKALSVLIAATYFVKGYDWFVEAFSGKIQAEFQNPIKEFLSKFKDNDMVVRPDSLKLENMDRQNKIPMQPKVLFAPEEQLRNHSDAYESSLISSNSSCFASPLQELLRIDFSHTFERSAPTLNDIEIVSFLTPGTSSCTESSRKVLKATSTRDALLPAATTDQIGSCETTDGERTTQKSMEMEMTAESESGFSAKLELMEEAKLLEIQIARLLKDLDSLSKKFESLSSRNEVTSHELASTKKALLTEEVRLLRANEEYDNLLFDKNRELEELKEKLKEMQLQAEKEISVKIELEEEVKLMEIQIARLVKDLNALSRNYQFISSQYEATSHELAHVKESLLAQEVKMVKANEDHSSQLFEKTRELDALRKKLEECEEEANLAKSRISSMVQDFRTLKSLHEATKQKRDTEITETVSKSRRELQQKYSLKFESAKEKLVQTYTKTMQELKKQYEQEKENLVRQKGRPCKGSIDLTDNIHQLEKIAQELEEQINELREQSSQPVYQSQQSLNSAICGLSEDPALASTDIRPNAVAEKEKHVLKDSDFGAALSSPAPAVPAPIVILSGEAELTKLQRRNLHIHKPSPRSPKKTYIPSRLPFSPTTSHVNGGNAQRFGRVKHQMKKADPVPLISGISKSSTSLIPAASASKLKTAPKKLCSTPSRNPQAAPKQTPNPKMQ